MGGKPSSPGLQALPGRASILESTFQPAFDYDRDSCYSAPAIGLDGRLNPGLPLTGKASEGCHNEALLTNTNSYSRSRCNGDWCGVVYDLYFEKDQSTEGPVGLGHRHDFEHVVSWIRVDRTRAPWNASLEYLCTSAHGSFTRHAKRDLLFDDDQPGNRHHAKVVYHKDGGLTHAFRKARTNDDPPENHHGAWQYPSLVGWDGYPDGFRDVLASADFGKANFGLKEGRFAPNLRKAMPEGIKFNPDGPDEFVWEGPDEGSGELRRDVAGDPAWGKDEL